MSRLIEEEITEIQSNLPKAAMKMADQDHIIVLKDARTIVSDGNAPSYINMSGNNGMATGGSGDVLTGVIASLAAQGLSAERAAVLGVWLHGAAGDEAAKEKSPYSMIARDLADGLSKVLIQTSRKKV